MESTYAVAAVFLKPVLVGVFLAGAGWLFRKYSRQEWVGRFNEGGNDYSEEVTIYKCGVYIFGRSNLTFDEDGKRLRARYKIRGTLKNLILTAYFEGIDNAERGAFLIKNSVRKNEYTGKYLLIDHADGVTSVDYYWKKS